MVNRKDRVESHSNWQTFLGDGKIALGCIFGVVLSVGTWLAFGQVLDNLSFSDLSQFVPSLVALLVAVVSALISYNAFTEQRRARQAGTDPVILVHLGSREDAPTLSTLEIENVGAGAALEVKIVFDTDISEYVPDRIITDFSDKLHPIKAIPSGSSKSFNFGLGHKLLGDEPVPPIEIGIAYKDIEGGKYFSQQTIDVRELSGQRADTPPLAKISGALEMLQKDVKALGASSKKWFVVEQFIDEYRSEEAQRLDELRAMHDAQKKRGEG